MKKVLKNLKNPADRFPGPGPGRTKGLKNKKTIIKETLILDSTGYFDKKFKENFCGIWDKVFEKALLGIPWAVEMTIERGMGKVKDVLEITKPVLTYEQGMAIIKQHEKDKADGSAIG